MTLRLLTASLLSLSAVSAASAQVPSPRGAVPEARATALANSNALDTAVEYQIGPEDVLDISVWKNPELSRTVPVRPDGKVSLPLLNDFRAAGLTPSDLREQLVARLSDFVPTPEVSVIVREVHSRKIAVVGAVKTRRTLRAQEPDDGTGSDRAGSGLHRLRGARPDRRPSTERRNDDAHPVQLPEDRRRHGAGELLRPSRRHRRRSVRGIPVSQDILSPSTDESLVFRAVEMFHRRH